MITIPITFGVILTLIGVVGLVSVLGGVIVGSIESVRRPPRYIDWWIITSFVVSIVGLILVGFGV